MQSATMIQVLADVDNYASYQPRRISLCLLISLLFMCFLHFRSRHSRPYDLCFPGATLRPCGPTFILTIYDLCIRDEHADGDQTPWLDITGASTVSLKMITSLIKPGRPPEARYHGLVTWSTTLWPDRSHDEFKHNRPPSSVISEQPTTLGPPGARNRRHLMLDELAPMNTRRFTQ